VGRQLAISPQPLNWTATELRTLGEAQLRECQQHFFVDLRPAVLTAPIQSTEQKALSGRASNVCNGLYIFAEDRVATLAMRTPERKPERAQSPHISLGGLNAAVNHPGGGRTAIDQHEAPPRLGIDQKMVARSKRMVSWRGNLRC
jgi:hypothetical protein